MPDPLNAPSADPSEQEPLPAGLYVIGTPIGNLQDITLRALNVLRQCEVVAAEDTRHSLKLFNHFQIQVSLLSVHEHNEASRVGQLMQKVQDGQRIGLITDAGMPGISDPGSRVVGAFRQAGLPCWIIPGPSALVAAFAGAGLQESEFYFGGFLPNRSGRRERALLEAGQRAAPSIFYESPQRIQGTLEAVAALLPEIHCVLCKELTKWHETVLRGTASQILEVMTPEQFRGEMVIILGGTPFPVSARETS